jgi:hypothetical protein
VAQGRRREVVVLYCPSVFDPRECGLGDSKIIERSVLLLKVLHFHLLHQLLGPLCFRNAVSGVVGLHGLHDGTPVFPRWVVGHPGVGVCLRKREAAHVATGCGVGVGVLHRDVPGPAVDLESVGVVQLVSPVGGCYLHVGDRDVGGDRGMMDVTIPSGIPRGSSGRSVRQLEDRI